MKSKGSVTNIKFFFFRFIAQIHDELLFEVEDSQIQEFSG